MWLDQFEPLGKYIRAYVDTLRVDATWSGSTWLGSAQARCHDIPPPCAPEFYTRSTKRRELFPDATSP
ncbi:hypothetical protein Hanom_Chr17g01533561 [Helianthus anomalus]